MRKLFVAVLAVVVLSIMAGCSAGGGGGEMAHIGYTGSLPGNCDCD